MDKVEAIADFYSDSYPEINAAKAINEAIEELKRIAGLTTFPVMQVTWETHLDNLSHEGCSRCHGKLVPEIGDDAVGPPISEGCTLCHYFL